MAQGRVLEFKIGNLTGQVQVQSETEMESLGNYGFGCDVCKNPIDGKRYHCVRKFK